MRTAFALSFAALAFTLLAVVPESARADYLLNITDVEGGNTYSVSLDISDGAILPAFPGTLSLGNSYPTINGANNGTVAISTAASSGAVPTAVAMSYGGVAGGDASFCVSATLGNIAFAAVIGNETIGAYSDLVDLDVTAKSSTTISQDATLTVTLTQTGLSLPSGYPNAQFNLSGGGGTAANGTQNLSLLYNGATILGPVSQADLGAAVNGIAGAAPLTSLFSLGVSDVMKFSGAPGAGGQVSSGNFTALAAVPEPCTLALLLSGLPLAVFRRQRRRATKPSAA